MSAHLLSCLPILALLVAACGSSEDISFDFTSDEDNSTFGEELPGVDGGQTGAETGLSPCQLVTSRDLTDAELAPLGFSADDVAERFFGVQQGIFEWETADPSAASLELVRGADPAQWFEWQSDPAQPTREGPGPTCEDSSAVHIPIDAVLTSQDGQLQESWQFTLQASSVRRASASRAIPVSGFTGDFDPVALLQEPEDTLDLTASLSLSDTEFRLILEGGASQSNTSSQDTLVQVRRVPIGQFTSSSSD